MPDNSVSANVWAVIGEMAQFEHNPEMEVRSQELARQL